MRIYKTLFLTFSAVLFFAASMFAHGVDCTFGSKAKSVKARYDDGSPMSYCDVQIFSPDGKEFQSGVTDRNGVFSFLPDTEGEWKIEIDDGMGHKANERVFINEKLEFTEKKEYRLPKVYGALTGLSLIFGIAGFIFMFGKRKEK